ncbi:hypothetical protein M0P65_06455 [Candidatus Gracilibacteria bacterium]|nr:hypothetical protein [Candidatus Gracilibacteria bacterium]
MKKIIFLVADSDCGKSTILSLLKTNLGLKPKGRFFLIKGEKWFIPQMSKDELFLDLDGKIDELNLKGYEGILIGAYQDSIEKAIDIGLKKGLNVSVLYLTSSLRKTYILDNIIFNKVKKTKVNFIESDSKNIKNNDNAKILEKLLK